MSKNQGAMFQPAGQACDQLSVLHLAGRLTWDGGKRASVSSFVKWPCWSSSGAGKMERNHAGGVPSGVRVSKGSSADRSSKALRVPATSLPGPLCASRLTSSASTCVSGLAGFSLAAVRELITNATLCHPSAAARESGVPRASGGVALRRGS